MPTALHVPSKGALRTLRNIALGTTCTVVFAAGLVTEDRRRRLSSLKKVHGNVQKIKSSRSYYGAGKALVDALDDSATAPESILLPGDPSMRKLIKDTNRALEFEGSISADFVDPATPPPLFVPFPGPIPKPPEVLWRPLPTMPTHPPINAPVSPPPRIFRVGVHDRQQKLANDVAELLGGGDDLVNTEAAASRFFEAFEAGLAIDKSGILPQLFDVAAELSKFCAEQSKLDYSERILDIILQHPPIDGAQFHRLQPYSVAQHLISGLDDKDLSKADADAKLKKAYSIYTTKFAAKPHTVPDSDLEIAQSVGEKLCATTCRAKLYNLTTGVYSFLPSSGDCSPQTLSHLITAYHALGDHQQVSHLFSRYTKELPDQANFCQTVSVVIDSALKTGNGNIRLAQEALTIASRVAGARGFPLPTTPILRVIGHQWRSTRNIRKTRELFEYLEPVACISVHPPAVYGAIIQFCVEADEEAAATSYYEKLRETHERTPADIRIYGHFALAKAMRNDWRGVPQDLQSMAAFSPNHKNEFNACFTPILKLFTKSHSVNETEDFVRRFIEQGHLKLTTFISNIMIDTYAKAREIESLVRWVEYATSVGCKLDAVSVNIILKNCHRTWKFPFEQTYRLYSRILSLGNSSRNLMDNDTIEILGRIAVNNSTSAGECDRRLRLLRKLGRQKHSWDSHGAHRAMKTTLAKEKPAATLKLYHSARGEEDMLLGSGHVVAAVKASLKINGDNIEDSVRLIKDAKSNCVNVEMPIATLIVHQMTQMLEQGRPVEHLPVLVQNTMSALNGNGGDISPPILTHTISLLERHGRFRQALDFWGTISQRQYIPRSSIDLRTVSVLLRVFIGLRDARGIRWVDRVIVENSLVPDVRLHLDVKKARKSATELEWPDHSEHISEFSASLAQLGDRVANLRNRAMTDNQNVSEMTIKIMESAIKDQKTVESPQQKGPITAHKEEQTTTSEGSLSALGFSESEEGWADSDEESCSGSSSG